MLVRGKKEVFTISEAGRDAFTAWFKRAPDPDLYRRELLLKFFFTSINRKDEMQHHLNQRLQELTKLQSEYVDIETGLSQSIPQNTYWLQSVQLGLQHLAIDIQWIKERLLDR